jgi:glycerate kinase
LGAPRLIVAPDKFKGSLGAADAAAAIARGLRTGWRGTEPLCIPMADGGEGTVDAFVAGGWERIVRRVHGPLGEPVDAAFAFGRPPGEDPAAVVEMAAASGLALLPEGGGLRPDIRYASTFGTGELVRAALDCGARRIVVALGGSATNDAGAGLLAALGVRFETGDGVALGPGGAALATLERIATDGLDPRLRHVRIEIAADVESPLTGPRGASRVFGPQKGANAADVAELERALGHFADRTAALLGRDVRDDPGSGAAGGLGFALRAYFGASIRSGAAVVADLRGLPEALRGAAWCFTGEGAIDVQTSYGKTVAVVGALAGAAGARTIAFGGRVEAGAERSLAEAGIVAVPILAEPATLAEAKAGAAELLERAAARIGRLIASNAGAP